MWKKGAGLARAGLILGLIALAGVLSAFPERTGSAATDGAPTANISWEKKLLNAPPIANITWELRQDPRPPRS